MKDFSCRCGCGFDDPYPVLLAKVEQLEAELDCEALVTSGCRCPTRNRIEGGTPNSYHLNGMAADLRFARGGQVVAINEITPLVEGMVTLNNCGLGLYDTFIHVDARGHRARWDERGA